MSRFSARILALGCAFAAVSASSAVAADMIPTYVRDAVADPGRGYMPDDGIDCLASYAVETSLDLEDRSFRQTTIWRPRLF